MLIILLTMEISPYRSTTENKPANWHGHGSHSESQSLWLVSDS